MPDAASTTRPDTRLWTTSRHGLHLILIGTVLLLALGALATPIGRLAIEIAKAVGGSTLETAYYTFIVSVVLASAFGLLLLAGMGMCIAAPMRGGMRILALVATLGYGTALTGSFITVGLPLFDPDATVNLLARILAPDALMLAGQIGGTVAALAFLAFLQGVGRLFRNRRLSIGVIGLVVYGVVLSAATLPTMDAFRQSVNADSVYDALAIAPPALTVVLIVVWFALSLVAAVWLVLLLREARNTIDFGGARDASDSAAATETTLPDHIEPPTVDDLPEPNALDARVIRLLQEADRIPDDEIDAARQIQAMRPSLSLLDALVLQRRISMPEAKVLHQRAHSQLAGDRRSREPLATGRALAVARQSGDWVAARAGLMALVIAVALWMVGLGLLVCFIGDFHNAGTDGISALHERVNPGDVGQPDPYGDTFGLYTAQATSNWLIELTGGLWTIAAMFATAGCGLLALTPLGIGLRLLALGGLLAGFVAGALCFLSTAFLGGWYRLHKAEDVDWYTLFHQLGTGGLIAWLLAIGLALGMLIPLAQMFGARRLPKLAIAALIGIGVSVITGAILDQSPFDDVYVMAWVRHGVTAGLLLITGGIAIATFREARELALSVD